MQEYMNMWMNYCNFSDRTNLRGYWMAVLCNFIVGAVLSVLAKLIGIAAVLSGLYSLAALIPSLALCVRRLRDAGKAWPWIFITLVPVVGWIILIILLCKGSEPDDGVPVV